MPAKCTEESMDKKAYAKDIQRLREYLLRSTGLAVLEVPDRLDAKSEFAEMGPTTLDNWTLKALAETIEVALEAFGAIQKVLGLSRHDPSL
jgi:hypothetical protein